MMPRTLTLIRHGLSESNLAKKLAEEQTPHPRERELVRRHTSERRLALLGVQQAQACGAWVRADMEARGVTKKGNRFYVSPFVRAIETAGNMRLGVDWRTPDARLCERNWGLLDGLTYKERIARFSENLKLRKEQALFWRPSEGETMSDVVYRVRDILNTLHRECSDMDVYMVGHGETMWVFRFVLEYWLPEELGAYMRLSENDGRIDIINCRVIQYTRQNEDQSWDTRFQRVRHINPHNPEDPGSNAPWTPIVRRMCTDDDLLAYAAQFPHFLTAA